MPIHEMCSNCFAIAEETTIKKLFSCKGCFYKKKVLYCSRTCQEKDWNIHKKICGLQIINKQKENGVIKKECENIKGKNIESELRSAAERQETRTKYFNTENTKDFETWIQREQLVVGYKERRDESVKKIRQKTIDNLSEKNEFLFT